jgi:hypothetical protein
MVIAKIISQKCKRRADLDDESSLFFSVVHRGNEWAFSIPQPLEPDGYTFLQLEIVEVQLSRLGLDLLPLDPYLN